MCIPNMTNDLEYSRLRMLSKGSNHRLTINDSDKQKNRQQRFY